MSDGPSGVRHVVAALPAIRVTACLLLWVVLLIAWLLPQIDLSLRDIRTLVLIAAAGRTVDLALRARPGLASQVARGLSIAADVVLLTGLLDITGGPFNPFIVVYAVYAWLAGVTLPVRWGVFVALASASGFGWLVLDHVQAPGDGHHRLNDFPAHLFAMWVSTAAVIELVAHYVARTDAALAFRQAQVDEARERAARSERLAALTTLAAGAAHELSTPLATIAVAARELERTTSHDSVSPTACAALADDARLIRAEVDRCQVILDRMSGRAGDGLPAVPVPLPPSRIVQAAIARLSDEQRARLRVEIAEDTAVPAAAGDDVAQALASLLKNAFEAGAADVRLSAIRSSSAMMRFDVHDTGAGMSSETLRRAGEPFFTTKEPGRGLGLGLFLARTFAERAGGRLDLQSGAGTTARLELPLLDTPARAVS